MNLTQDITKNKSVCPVTRLPITSKPEWTDIKVAKDYSVTFKLIGKSTICTILNGVANDSATEKIIKKRREFLKQAGLAGKQYTEVRDYGGYIGRPAKKSRMLVANMLREETESSNLLGFWIYNAPLLVNMAFNVGVKIFKSDIPVRSVKDYKEAINLAIDQLTKSSIDVAIKHEEKVVIELSDDTETIYNSSQIEEFSDELFSFFTSINWDRPGAVPEKIEESHPFKSVFEAVEIIKSDIDDVFRKQKKNKLKLKESEKRYRTIIETINDGYFEVDLKGIYTFVNSSMCKIFGYTKEELVGMSYKQLTDEAYSIKVYNLFNSIYKGKRKTDKAVDWECVRKDGCKIYVEASASLIIGKNEKPTGFRGIIRDISDRIEAEEKNRTELERMNNDLERAIEKSNEMFVESAMAYLEIDQIFKASSEGIWVIDSSYKILRVNDSFVALTDKTSEYLIGKNCYEMFTNKNCHTENCPLKIIMEGNTSHIETDLEIEAEDGTIKPFILSAHPYQNTASKTIGVIIGLRDITELKKAEKLQSEKIKAEADNSAKSNFLANVSHEIRTPLNGIIGMTELIENTKLNDNQKEIFNTISNEAKSLVNIISDVLDFSKIEAGKYDLEKIPFDIRILIDDISNNIVLRAWKKDLEFVSFLSPDIPSSVIGDPGKLRQILMNLTGNSLKFTHEGGLSLIIKKLEEDNENLTLVFSVIDTGIGIAKEHQEKIFECFTQADDSMTRQYGGTGLGTAISKQLVELMNGEIGMESEPGEGSKFWFTIELRKQQVDKIERREEIDLENIKVLIIGEKKNYQHAQIEYLKSWGCIPFEANNGEEALSVYKKAVSAGAPPDLLLIVHPLPEMSGFELAEKIRSIETPTKVAIILITSVGWTGDSKLCKEIGIEGYLTRPFKSDAFHKAIKLVLNSPVNDSGQLSAELVTKHILAENEPKELIKKSSYVDAEIDDKPEQLTSGYNAEYAIPKNDIHILLVEDYPANQQVALAHLNGAGYNVDLAENGQQAVKQFKNKYYDLVLMDIQMPVMGGFEATKNIRDYEKTDAANMIEKGKTPIIATTAHAMTGYKQLCLDAEMNDYITKPLSRKNLLAIVEKWISKNARTQISEPVIEEVNHEDKPSETDSDILDKPYNNDPMDYDVALEEFMGKKDILTQVLDVFLTSAKDQIMTLRKAIKNKDFQVIKREAHTIKGGAANLTAYRLSEIAKELEICGETENLDKADFLLNKFEIEFNNLGNYLQEKLDS